MSQVEIAGTRPVVVRGLTLWQPWAWTIVHGPKRIENRPWHPHRGVTHVLLHAGKVFDKDSADEIACVLERELPPEAHVSSAVVGVAKILGCIHNGVYPAHPQSVWWTGPHGWILDDVRPLATPVPCKGALGMWEPPADVLAACLAQVGPLVVAP